MKNLDPVAKVVKKYNAALRRERAKRKDWYWGEEHKDAPVFRKWKQARAQLAHLHTYIRAMEKSNQVQERAIAES